MVCCLFTTFRPSAVGNKHSAVVCTVLTPYSLDEGLVIAQVKLGVIPYLSLHSCKNQVHLTLLHILSARQQISHPRPQR